MMTKNAIYPCISIGYTLSPLEDPFKKGGATQISSKMPEVQETIERIRNKEAEKGAPADG